MNRILLSIAVIAAVAAVGVGGSVAFFSDSETSTGNTISAGAIDLKIDNTSYLNNVANPGTTWALKDLTSSDLFFNFSGLQPAWFGEDTISLHTTDPAYACMKITTTADDDVSCTDPENEAETAGVCENSLPTALTDGELGAQLNFSFWGDDGDNVFEVGEVAFASGTASTLFNGAWKTIVDPVNGSNLFGGVTPIPAATTVYVGKYWCYGTYAPAPVIQDGLSTVGPDIRGSGFTCDGASADNKSQTDKLMADVVFHGVQSASNGSFNCTLLP